MTDSVIVDAVRTPVGRHGGVLSRVRPDDLGACVLGALRRRTGIDPAMVDDVIFGCANQAGEDNRNVARMSALLAGYPVEVPGQTVNRLCGSGLQAVATAANMIRAGEARCVIAGGVESMSRAPWVTLKPEEGFSRAAPQTADTTVGWRFVNPRMPPEWTISLGETAEEVACRFGISREEQDAFAFESQQRAARAIADGRFRDEIEPVTIARARGEPVTIDRDEHPRPDVTLEGLRAMKPVFRAGGTVTAGTSSGINDGAAALLLMSRRAAEQRNLAPFARILGSAVAGVSPDVMGIGPVPAIRKLLDRLQLTVEDLDLIELNEAFASQSLACMRELGLPPDKVNVNGGAIALGHPLGASGARLLTSLLHEMRRRRVRYGLAALCIGVGQGIATVVERVE